MRSPEFLLDVECSPLTSSYVGGASSDKVAPGGSILLDSLNVAGGWTELKWRRVGCLLVINSKKLVILQSTTVMIMARRATNRIRMTTTTITIVLPLVNGHN